LPVISCSSDCYHWPLGSIKKKKQKKQPDPIAFWFPGPIVSFKKNLLAVQSPSVEKKKKKGHARLVRSSDHRLPLWSSASSRRTLGADRPTSDILCGPAPDRPNFFWGQVSVYKKKKTNYFVRFASPSRCRVFLASYISAVDIFLSVSLPRQRVTTVST
jgi:hypothetical protein